ncbi:hypothetical protein IM538_13805 [Cytobacillus suaedae]|nr:hypothetical protein IM538_13805 [Cytobacillus suaedae]
MKKFLLPFALFLIFTLIISNLENNQSTHKSISLEKIEEIVIFREFHKEDSGGGGVTFEHQDFR